MDSDTLKTFVAVVRGGSFAEAARAIDMAPSSVSRAISGLEDELGTRLFQRTTRSLALTDAGRLYFDRVGPVLDELEAAATQARDASTRPVGTLKITAPVSFAQLNLMPILPVFSRAFPDVDLDLLLTDQRVDLLASRVDLAIRLGRLEDSEPVAQRLCSLDTVLCASPSYLKRAGVPKWPGDVSAHRCLVFPQSAAPTQWRFRDAQDSEIQIVPPPSLAATNALALRDAAVNGMGLLVSPRWAVGRQLADGLLVEVMPSWRVSFTHFDAVASILLPSRAYVPLKVRAFIDFIKPRFANGPPSACAAG